MSTFPQVSLWPPHSARWDSLFYSKSNSRFRALMTSRSENWGWKMALLSCVTLCRAKKALPSLLTWTWSLGLLTLQLFLKFISRKREKNEKEEKSEARNSFASLFWLFGPIFYLVKRGGDRNFVSTPFQFRFSGQSGSERGQQVVGYYFYPDKLWKWHIRHVFGTLLRNQMVYTAKK